MHIKKKLEQLATITHRHTLKIIYNVQIVNHSKFIGNVIFVIVFITVRLYLYSRNYLLSIKIWTDIVFTNANKIDYTSFVFLFEWHICY